MIGGVTRQGGKPGLAKPGNPLNRGKILPCKRFKVG